ncbi:MAG TPA: hypothetical protein PLZ51_21895, partial [Aggregatilineales bacterium]|nr:hypothetical protein [Aggregatilineales bacterium]
GYGVGANGCPNNPPDTDGDGVLDPNDACPNQGSIGYGIYSNGCPIQPTVIPDSDGDGILDPNDDCPYEGDSGHGINSRGCPFPPPPPDSNGDGILDPNDACPNQGNQGYGVMGNGCPNPPPTPIVGDSDNDGTLDNVDQCSTIRGALNNSGCPYNPGFCQVAFLENEVNLRSGPALAFTSQIIKSYHDTPIRVVNILINSEGETWYELQGSIPLYVREDVVNFGEPCDIGLPIQPPTTTVTETPTPAPTEATAIREIPPDTFLADLGCAIQPGETIDEAILALIVEAPDPCRAKSEFNYRPNLISYVESAKNYFDDDSEKQHFFDTLLTCNTTIVEWVIQWASSDENKSSLERLMQGISGDVCASMDTWRNAPQTPLPPNPPPQEA